MASILLIDDDESLLDILSLSLEDAGHQVLCARDGLEGFTKVRAHRPDLVISDINMPGLDGFTLCRRLREVLPRTRILLLSSRDSEIDESLGLDLGADDYIAKPFSTRILLAHINALLRRQGGDAPNAQSALRVGSLALDDERFEVSYQGKSVAVTGTEFRLLKSLISRPGVVCSRDRLLSVSRSDGSTVDMRLIDSYVRRLRRKFESIDPQFDQIETMIGVGYRWKEQDA